MFPVVTPELHDRWFRSIPFFVVGVVGVIGGGIAAAVTGPTNWSDGSWAAAFAVLVVGVAQICVGVAQSAIGPSVPSKNEVALQCATWNLGCALVIGGTLADLTALTVVGSVVFLVALVLCALALRGTSQLDGTSALLLKIYRLLLVLLLVSTPVGIFLSVTRAS